MQETDTTIQPSASPISVLAVVALVLAVIPLCVPINLLGFVLGMVAIRRIERSDGGLRGRPAAMVAIWGGLIMAAIGWWAFSSLQQWAEDEIHEGMVQSTNGFVHALQSGANEELARFWSPHIPLPTAADRTQLRDALNGMGPDVKVAVISMEPVQTGDLLTPQWSAWLRLSAGAHQHDGAARVDVMPGQASFRCLLRRFTVKMPSGDIVLGGQENSE